MAEAAAKPESFDAGVLIAREMEYEVFAQVFRSTAPRIVREGRHYRVHTATFADGPQQFVCRYMAEMGTSPTILDVEHLLSDFGCKVVVNVGIAGALHEDVK